MSWDVLTVTTSTQDDDNYDDRSDYQHDHRGHDHCDSHHRDSCNRQTDRQITRNVTSATQQRWHSDASSSVGAPSTLFCLRFVCFALLPSCRQISHAAILWVKLSEMLPSCRQNSHATIMWVKPSETPPSCRQNSQDIMSVLYNIHYNVTPGDREAVTWPSLNANVRYIPRCFSLRLVCFFDVTVSIFIKYSLNLLISAILQ